MLDQQLALEHEMIQPMQEKVGSMFKNNEAKGKATNNPYIVTLQNEYVLPLSALIKEEILTPKAGRAFAHTVLLKGLDLDTIAVISIHKAMNMTLEQVDSHSISMAGGTLRTLAYALGKQVYDEILLKHFEDVNPHLYHYLVNDFRQSLTKDVRHRMTVFKMQAAANGIEFPTWTRDSKEQVGIYLVGAMERVGFLRTVKRRVQNATGLFIRSTDAVLSEEAESIVVQITDYVIDSAYQSGPCIIPPNDWISLNEGGYYSEAMRCKVPCMLIKESFSVQDDMPMVREAVNHLQRVPWKINSRVLFVAQNAVGLNIKEVPKNMEALKPEFPSSCVGKSKKEEMDPEQLVDFVAWKRCMSEWYTEKRIMLTAEFRWQMAIRNAIMYKDYERIFFVWQADFRGRLYPKTSGVSPQGSDLQKALLMFADGKPVTTPSAIKWFKINGANRWGFDNAPLEERVQWVNEHHESIISFAKDPLNNQEWTNADKPFQFLAWCIEYADWVASPSTFLSRLSVGLDGSCNGLQNFSAMLRDEVGGKATNLTNNAVRQDLYANVAEATVVRLLALEDDDKGFRQRWLAHGVNRTAVKRIVMTTPYGLTKQSAVEYLVQDYLKDPSVNAPFLKSEWYAAARYLVTHGIWEAISDVVIKAREAMDWLRLASREIIKDGAECITWTTPSGFVVEQVYHQKKIRQIRSYLHGVFKINVSDTTDQQSLQRHRDSLSPNFIHSMDAAHLHLSCISAKHSGINSLAMIHDDYGTHAADTQELYEIIRQSFVEMYSTHNPLEDFAKSYNIMNELPKFGTLDIQEVIESEYFFS